MAPPRRNPVDEVKLNNKIIKNKVSYVKIKCGICFKSIGNKPALATRCGHLFCKRCFQDKLHNPTRCPKCRKNIGKHDGYHTIYLEEIQPSETSLKRHGLRLKSQQSDIGGADGEKAFEAKHQDMRKMLLDMNDTDREATIRKMFDSIDADGKGYFTPADVRQWEDNWAVDERLLELIHGADLDGDGQVSYQEFRIIILSIVYV